MKIFIQRRYEKQTLHLRLMSGYASRYVHVSVTSINKQHENECCVYVKALHYEAKTHMGSY